MAYYLRKSSRSRGIYLQIYNSFFDPVKKVQEALMSRRSAMSAILSIKESTIRFPSTLGKLPI
ncbi:hypothetical protein [Dubosiella newyorkensis]|uniref:hypothetical protein n=1 Tax=Dubosiella newyorkensis TaxID=1862672 RepID=UPI0026757A9F|nr:hypothetical protein [Dubosiella newyorkensis]